MRELLPHDQIEEVAEQRAVLDGGGEDRMSGDRGGPVPDQLPQVGVHRLQPPRISLVSRIAVAGLGPGGRSSSRWRPSTLRHRLQQQTGDEPALRQLQRPCGDVGPVPHVRQVRSTRGRTTRPRSANPGLVNASTLA